MKNKTILITGANAGIGKSTATGLAAKGAKVVIVCRNEEKALATLNEIAKASGNENVDYLFADLSSQREVRLLADNFKAKHDKLDVLINNAGAFFSELKYSEDNIEMQFATNHLSYFLLTNLLLDMIKSSTTSRIVNVASHSHYSGVIDFDDINRSKKYDGLKAYEQSKLGNVLFTLELARRLNGTGVTANALHPGVVRTEIAQKNARGIYRLGWTLIKPFMITPEKGAATSIYLASSPEVENITGKYFANCKQKYPSRKAQDEQLAGKFWEFCEKAVGF